MAAYSNLTDRTIWLTGASSGIGKTLSQRLCAAGNKLIVSSRSSEALEQLSQEFPDQVQILTADLSKPGSEVELSSNLSALTDSIDTVILNAGGCEYLDVENYDHALVERVAQVNYLGFSRCLHACLPLLRNSGKDPHLVGISSASVFFGLPRAEAYGGSKAAMTYFLQSLRNDLAQHGVDVSIVYPGFIDTPLTRKNDFAMPGIMSTDQAADIILSGIEKRRAEIAFPRSLIWTLKLLAMLPISISKSLAQRMVRKGSTA